MPRNPTWERDELILALELYRRIGMAGSGHPEVIELSRLLNRLALSSERPNEYRQAVESLDADERSRLRNPNGVAMKLANFASLDPNYAGVALSRGGRGDAAVWAEFEADPEQLTREATAIRAQAATESPV